MRKEKIAIKEAHFTKNFEGADGRPDIESNKGASAHEASHESGIIDLVIAKPKGKVEKRSPTHNQRHVEGALPVIECIVNTKAFINKVLDPQV